MTTEALAISLTRSTKSGVTQSLPTATQVDELFELLRLILI